MARRTISLKRSAYERHVAAQRPGESFSDVVNRLTRRGEPSLLDLVGVIPLETADPLQDAERRRRAEQAGLSENRAMRLLQED